MTGELRSPGPSAVAVDPRPAPTPHPAKYSENVLTYMRMVLERERRRGQALTVLDPFAGVGGIHDLTYSGSVLTYAIELEPEWAEQSGRRGPTMCADFFDFLPGMFFHDNGVGQLTPEVFDVIATSPAYGNRMADHHNPSAADTSTRITYKHKLGRDLTPGNSGAIGWFAKGNAYHAFHERAYQRFAELVVPGGLVLLNVSDFIARKQTVQASIWHRDAMVSVGGGNVFELVKTWDVPTPRMRYGANATARVDSEQLHVFRRLA